MHNYHHFFSMVKTATACVKPKNLQNTQLDVFNFVAISNMLIIMIQKDLFFHLCGIIAGKVVTLQNYRLL